MPLSLKIAWAIMVVIYLLYNVIWSILGPERNICIEKQGIWTLLRVRDWDMLEGQFPHKLPYRSWFYSLYLTY